MTNTMPSLAELLLATGTKIIEISAEDHARLVEVISAFDSGVECTLENTAAMRIIAGNINATYCLLHEATGRKFIIQQLNTIFDIGAIDNNLRWLEQAQALSRDALPAGWQSVGYADVAGQPGRKIFHAADGAAWRVMHFVPGDIKIFNSFSEVPAEARRDVARSLGEAIAVFGRMLESVPSEVWQEPLPNFHNARYHLDYLAAIIRGDRVRLSLSRDASRQVVLQPEIWSRDAGRIERLLAKIEARRYLLSALDSLGSLVTHGDTKINNFVFRPDAGGRWQCVCLIDLDTVQRGNMLDDLGDALRSAGNPAGEEPRELDDVSIDREIVNHIIDGYLTRITAFYGAARERELRAHVLDAGRQFLYVQCARFFADALVGNAYFKPKPGHHEDINLYRAEVQMRALEEMEKLG